MRLLQGYVLPSLVTALAHAALIYVLSANWDQNEPRRVVRPQIVQAKLVQLQQAKPKEEPVKKPVQVAPKVEPAKQPPAKTVSTKKQDKKPEKKSPPKPDPKKVQQEKERAERERRAKEEAAREQQLAAMMAQEEAYLEAQSQEQSAMSHIGAIQQAIADVWSRPPSARRDMQVELLINLIPTGEVVSVRVLKGSGNAAFDRSAVNAVNKAQRFPELAQLAPRVFEQYFRELRLVFRPEDLRL